MLALVTATFNSIRTIGESIASAREISGDVRHYFVDGGSIDGTVELLRNFATSADNVVVENQHGTGLYGALNQGIQSALFDDQVTHVGVLHSDDRLIPGNYSDYLSCIEGSHADVFYSDIEFHNSYNDVVRIWRSGEFSALKLNTGWMPPHTSIVVRKGIYEDLGLYNPEFGTAADYEWIVRVFLARANSVQYFRRRTLSMLVGGASSASIRTRLRANAMDGRVWATRSKLQSIVVRVCKPMRKLGQFRSIFGSARARSQNAPTLR